MRSKRPTNFEYIVWFMAILSGCGIGYHKHRIEKNDSLPINPTSIPEIGTPLNEVMDRSIRRFYTQPTEKISGVALVIHGLNLRPSKMDAIISLLTASNIEVLSLSLRGHGQNYNHKTNMRPPNVRMEAFKNVSYQLWIEEALRAYHYARKRSDEQKVPLFLVGFSYGALLGSDLLATYPDVHFSDKNTPSEQ